ncbi:unnamed protein product [Prorocentrum cordatum]|uniref:Sodium/calcium exchanger membrane region domain-containing protein n=1 Tax=Prorocentrum cordatum TaxID=2364126 RepID=A0ABN9SUC5_9DINO|nr:unnamed protein product [Polarella glacialis]
MPTTGDALRNGRLKDVGEGYAYSVQSSRSDSDSDDNGEVVMRRAASGEHSLRSSLSHVLMGSSLNVLLVFVPLAVLASPEHQDWGHAWTFAFALAALIPFAERVSFVTEDVAKYTSDTVGGLLNASFGNITELVVCVFMLKTGGSMMLRLVQVSMLGSVLSNLLLVLGSAFLVGGIRHKEQVFKPAVSGIYSVLLLFAVLGMSLPLALAATHTGAGDARQEGDQTAHGGEAPLWLSRFIAVVMLFIYGLLILFQLKTHSHLLEGMEDGEDEPGVLGLWGGVLWLAFTADYFFYFCTVGLHRGRHRGCREGHGHAPALPRRHPRPDRRQRGGALRGHHVRLAQQDGDLAGQRRGLGGADRRLRDPAVRRAGLGHGGTHVAELPRV